MSWMIKVHHINFRYLSHSVLFATCAVHPMAAIAESLTVTNAPRPFSIVVPVSWKKAPNMTANTRVSYSSPSGRLLANCAVTAIEFRGESVSQKEIAGNFQNIPSTIEMANDLSVSYNNVRVISITKGLLSDYPAWVVKYEASVGSPSGEDWIVMISTITAVAPNITWQVGCGGTGGSLQEARNAFHYWQSDIVGFPKNFRIH